MEFEPVIGLEVHAELQTRSKMFCACPVVDLTEAPPNTAVCPVCAGMPGTLPVVNQKAVEYGLRVALALECRVAPVSIFARKNYFYPDLPKGYQITQYEQPLAQNGRLVIRSSQGEQVVRIRRVHLEEDTGKLTHVTEADPPYSLVDLNRAGVPLLEIVSEPDLHSVDAVRAFSIALRDVLRYLEVNSGDMEKGVIRFEANVSVRSAGSQELGTRVEIKNLNSFRSMERAVIFEIERQSGLVRLGKVIEQETLGWNDLQGTTFSQRSKEDAHDYRYFPEPDLPPLVIAEDWIKQILSELPELPYAKFQRFRGQYGLGDYDSDRLTTERVVADYFEQVAAAAGSVPAKTIANWLIGDLFALMNQSGIGMQELRLAPSALAELLKLVSTGEINQTTAKAVLAEMFSSGRGAAEIVAEGDLQQVSDSSYITGLVRQVLEENHQAVESYRAGKVTIANWLLGQVMKAAGGRLNPQLVRQELERQLLM
jgi:aspartyl-tRNA(Asn)/glutamyl-tRNA(Gln) amidotransferase subunit B